ncbi:MAG: hypothetical protein EOP82_31840 [Variovorax sp.]|nr:MAG: hypothetical protein EOP82_31840 [Variovorax sp.]
MSDDYQIDIPPSFFALYTDARQRLSEPISVVRARYEVCEDLAQLLVAQAQLLHHTELPSEEGILSRIHAGLQSAESGVSAAEAGWIVRRLAELLGWDCPALEPGDAS